MLARPVESFASPESPLWGAVVRYDRPEPLETHMHQCFEVGLLVSGRQERHFEGFVVEATPGDVWLNAAWEPHGWQTLTAGTCRLSLHFVAEFLGDETFEGMPWLVLFASRPEERPRVTSAEMREELLGVGGDLCRELEERRWGWQSAVRLGILHLLLAISRAWKPRSDHTREGWARMHNLARIMPAVQLLHSQHPRRVSRDKAAAACGLGVSQFSFLFRHTMGMSFGRFSIRHRLGHAAHLLLTTDLPVDEIARETGFAHASHLHRSFVRSYGYTPFEYRQRRQRGEREPGAA